ncbi:hypothetical protein [Streptomyces sp. ICBB 8177]|uniref:hypothetical protein n=1 Tax=Streptomyces sp. ICBB 8177 TaxID=563922 RepID=UPI0018EE532D|nr:hypothetical protein [Streptomyces sp. ICBB 8177]
MRRATTRPGNGTTAGRAASRAVTRALRLTLGLAVLGGAAAGCGIRATAVPVDAGPAPTRVSCALPRASASDDAAGLTSAEVYLVCSQRVSPVQRAVPAKALNQSGRLNAARLLLAELERKPDQAEEKGGFATEVPGGLQVSGPAQGDPAATLRLDQDPDDLPSYAMGQLVCTFAGTPAGDSGRTVVLGGPDPHVPPRRYTCDETMRTVPDAGTTAGKPVS